MALTVRKSENEDTQIAKLILRGSKDLSLTRRRIQSNAFDFYKYVLLMLIVCVCSSAGLAANELSIAPVNPEFTARQTKNEMVLGIAEQGYQGHALGYIPSPVDRSHLLARTRVHATMLEGEGAPSNYDLRTLGYVTPVKNQGGCGSCWSFATYGSLESWLKKNSSETRDFSENHMKNYHGFDPAPCDGGNADMSTAYLVRWGGPVSEADDPYHDWDDRPSPGGPCQKYVEKVLWFFTSNDMKNAIMTYGGMHVTMRMDSAYYNASQYTYYYSGANTNVNHAVTLMGWDDNKVVTGAPGNGAWLIKNSWGTSWGDNGYFWISYYDTVAVKYAVAFCDAVSTSSYKTNYQYDPLGLTAMIGYGSPTAWAANIFIPTTSGQLKAVGLYAIDDAMSYTIYVYDNFNGSTFSNLLGSVSGTLTNGGYHTIPLSSPINLTTGNNFSIVAKFTTTGYGYPIPAEVNVVGYSSSATAGSGQSYISSNGTTFTDITTISKFEKTNICIRGLTAMPVVLRTLTVSSGTGGTVTTPGIGTYTYPYGTNANIVATANTPHYHFVNWSGTGVTGGKVANPNLASTTITMDANYTVQANFALDQKSLTTSATAGGTVTTPGIGTYFYPYGSDANIVATANPSYHFMNWTGTAVTAGKVANANAASTKVTMDANYTVQANFAINQYTITATADANGSISPSGTIVKTAGESQIFTATPNTGYTVDTWLVDGSVVQAGSNTYILEDIDADHTVQVNFIIDERLPAFPGAEGSGCFAKGGRGGDVYEVNNLNNSGLGSIVDAVSEGNRTIVFRVSGTILLGDVMLQPKSNTTIAGQTALGDGICIKGRIYIHNVSNVVIRYLRVRVDEGAANSNGDAIDIDGSNRIIIDHVTASYSRDEGISCREDTDNITVQWCIISEALTFENHSYGSLIRGQFGNTKTYHHNLYAHNNGRNPRPGNYADSSTDAEGLHCDFRNNVVYNWSGSTAGYNDDGPGYVSRYNFIGNAFIKGLESSGSKPLREKSTDAYGYSADNSLDNIVPGDPWSLVNFSGFNTAQITIYKARSYLIPMEAVTTTSPAQAKIDVLTDAGASFPRRDIIDARIVDDVLNKTGHSIYDTSYQPEGGWPTLNSLPAPADSDHDGMPDKWETKYHLNLNDAADRNGYNFDANYTNLEVYLNGLLVETLPQVNWTQRHNGTANKSDYAKDIAVDSAGDVIVSGYAKNTGTDYDFVTIKYTPDGNMVWKKTYSCPGSYADFASAMAVDTDSNIVVAGYSYTATNYDGIIIKYNSSGSQLWAQKYNYSAGPLAVYSSTDYFYDVATDSNGNIYAVGRKDKDCLVVKYTPDGVFSWARIYNGAANGWDMLYGITIDSSGNVYACGETAGIGTDQDCLTLKYSPDGTLLWAKTYNGSANGWDLLEAIALDSARNAYVTGSVETATDSNYVTIKYSPDGDLLWTAFYSGTASGWDEAYAITLTSDGNVAVTGYSQGSSSADAATVKYDSQTGSQLWAVRYNGIGNSTDYTEAIAADRIGRVYVHGRSAEIGSTDYLTICYDSDGIQQWKMNYDGLALLTDVGSAIAVDNGIVYVTGCSMAADGTYDYATIRYTQHDYCPGIMGDLNGDCTVNFFDFALFAESYVASQDDYLTLNDIADAWLECGLLIPQDCYVTTSDANSPQNLMVPPMGWDDTQIILIWSKPVDYSQVTDYRVYQNGTVLGLSGRFDTTKPKLYYTVTGLIANTTYSFTVRSVLSSGGESAASNTCTKTTTAMPTVLNIANPPYNASNNGTTKNTAAIQQAINDCPAGGVVLIPAGGTGYLTGAIYLKSNMTLKVDGTLIGAEGSEATDYLQTSLRVPYYKGGNNFMGLVNAYNNYTDPDSAGKPYILENIRICGSGTISGDIHDPGTGKHVHTHVGTNEYNIIHDDTRIGDMITIKGVTNFYIGGWGSGTLTLQRPPEHTMFISYCNGVTVNALNVTTYDLHNGDGLNLATSDTAYIFNSTFDTGDDCINMNAGQGQMGVTENVPVQNVRCFDCTTLRGHGGWVIGSFTAAWVQDCVVEDLLISGTEIGIRQKTGANNGGGGRRNLYRDIRIVNVTTKGGIFLDSTYDADDYYGDGGVGQFSNNTYKNITVTAGVPSILVNGLSGTPHNNNIFDHITGNNVASLNWCTNSTFSYVTVTNWLPYTNCSGNIDGGNNTPEPPF